ncbi:MAG: tripartite tricarboxylate transporter permease [Candidatus Marinimicrobia bacterium]|nr:tripartite tricarboxylate transporter permease [Candidatus Neomarinimicrobiota bacterium]
MELLTNLLSGFSALLGTETIPWWQPGSVIMIGITIGIFVGVMPGLSASTGLALMVPFTFGMDPLIAIVFLVSIYTSCAYGGTITAIAINTPGTPAAVAVAMDGYALTQQGKPGRALGTSLLANVMGGITGSLILIFFSFPISKVALKFGPPAFFSLAIFGLTIVASMESKNRIKAFFSTALGLLLMTVGLDIINAHPRFTFGQTELFDGFSFIPALIGLFALGEILLNIEKDTGIKKTVKTFSSNLPKFSEIWSIRKNVFKGGAIGALVGAVPGAGATIAAFVAYGEAKRSSKDPDKFGTGSLEGIAAPSAAAGASEGGALIPLLTLGIPGSAATAVMIGALTLHNIIPGPELFTRNAQLVYALFASLPIGIGFMLLIGYLGTKIWVKLIAAPKAILLPVIIAIAFVGSYAVKNTMFDVYVCLGFGILGWILRRNGFPTAPMVLAMILGKMAETNFRQALLAEGTWSVFFTNPLSLGLLILAVFSLVWPIIKERKKRASSESVA